VRHESKHCRFQLLLGFHVFFQRQQFIKRNENNQASKTYIIDAQILKLLLFLPQCVGQSKGTYTYALIKVHCLCQL